MILHWEGNWNKITSEEELLLLAERKKYLSSPSTGPFKDESWEPYGKLANLWKTGVDIGAWKKIASLEEEIEIEREEATKALEKAQEWRERQLKERDDKINELEDTKRGLIKLLAMTYNFTL